jgi:outer membrane receptor protein involved in Fe transport
MSTLNRLAYLIGAALIASLTVSAPSHAQQDPGDEGAQGVLEEIIVTARFREESIQDIGASVSALGGDELIKFGVTNIDDLARSTVGLNNVRLRQNDNEVSIRGVSNLGTSFFSSSSVFTAYVDDISVTSAFGQRDFGMLDLDRIELVRGPQPTLFGEGAVGGVIRYFTRDPYLSGPKSTGQASAGMESMTDGGLAYVASGAASLVFAPDKAGLRVSGYYKKDEGFIDNRLSGEEDTNDFESFGGRAVLLLQPNERLSARLSVFIARDEHGFDSSIEPGTDPEDFVFGIPGLPDGAFPGFVATGSDDFDLYSASISYDFGPVEVTSITGFYERDREIDTLDIGTSVGLQPFFPTINTTSFGSNTFAEDMLSEELRIASKFDGPVNFIAGAFYRDRDIALDRRLVIPEFPAVSTPPSDVGQQNVTNNESSQISGFAEFTWSVTDRLRLIGGVRYVDDTYTSDFEETIGNLNPANAPFTPDNPIDFLFVNDVLAAIGVPPPFEFELTEFLPRAAVEFDVSDDVLIYANGARGIRNGGVGSPLAAVASSGNPADPGFLDTFVDNLLFDEDSVVSVDLGVKAVWLDGALRTNIGLFRTEYEDTQIMVLAPVSNTVNGPDQVISGIELETEHQWNDSFATFLNATFLDSEFQDNFSITGMGTDIQEGDEAINAPDLSFSLGYDFSMPMRGRWRFVSSGSFQYVGERFSDASNFPSGELDSLGLLNLRIGLESDRLSFTAFASNALNDVEVISAGVSAAQATRDENGNAIDGPVTSQYVNHPRSIGVGFTVRY